MSTTPLPYDLPAEGDPVTAELEIKRSRFIAWIARASDEAAARALVDAARAAYPDARHHCFACIVDGAAANPIERSSDDGEPSGTAGTPMLDVLRGTGMRDIAAVVTRYFGGVKLGAGGLVHAYSNAVSEALTHVPRVRRHVAELATVALPHADAGRIEAELRHAGIDIADVTYGSLAEYTLAFTPGQRERVDAILAAATHGTAITRSVGHQWVEATARG
ncbi:IMPACT family protein [Corynebacterium lipophiloflavum]|uniref:YigZ family protein n=1 Tax=Corynebacterium lipophiloflavum (strain ATCC 700352 / DSM 44291 / CCUG 37336 / JCM 10383 / DMMZ 1944) TaxID=525263 RepID=C0XS32_CORLD|nr:YigZ family protein [Corynebacterium lipophiloflavum]EEI16927.1 putative YigZ family protein [Corynebacterium lipophiloflavum DSM 44291]